MTTGYPDPPTPLLDLPGWLKRAKKPLFSVHNDNSWLIGQFMHMRGIPKVIFIVICILGLWYDLWFFPIFSFKQT